MPGPPVLYCDPLFSTRKQVDSDVAGGCMENDDAVFLINPSQITKKCIPRSMNILKKRNDLI